MKRVLSYLLLTALILGCLSGCGMSESDRIAQIEGVWVITVDDSVEQAQALLDNIDMYPEETALCDLTSLDYVEAVKFSASKYYEYFIHPEGTKECVRDFYTRAFHDIYLPRDTLNAVYETDFSAMSEEEFQQFYADLYGFESFTLLMDEFVEDAYDYSALLNYNDIGAGIGTFSMKSGKFVIKKDGDSESYELPYTYDEASDTLTLKYSNSTDVMTRYR